MSDTTPRKTFIDLCLEGYALLEDIHDYIDEWHESEGHISISEYLGMEAGEYNAWVEEPSVLRLIVNAKRNQLKFDQVLSDKAAYSLAARSSSPEEALAIEEWLRKTGRL